MKRNGQLSEFINKAFILNYITIAEVFDDKIQRRILR